MRSGVEAPTGSPHVDVCEISAQRSNLITIPSQINAVNVDAIVDTASEVSIISRKTFEKTGLEKDAEMPAVTLRMANGILSPANQQATTTINIGNSSYDVCLIVVEDFPYDILLGLDFILCYDTSIISKEGEVWIGESCFQLPNPKFRSQHRNLCRNHFRTTIAPRTEVILPIRCPKNSSGVFIVEGTEICDSMGISVAATLSTASDRLLYARVANITASEIVLDKGMVLFKCEKVEFASGENEIDISSVKEFENVADVMQVDSDLLYSDESSPKTRNFKSSELDIGKKPHSGREKEGRKAHRKVQRHHVET